MEPSSQNYMFSRTHFISLKLFSPLTLDSEINQLDRVVIGHFIYHAQNMGILRQGLVYVYWCFSIRLDKYVKLLLLYVCQFLFLSHFL